MTPLRALLLVVLLACCIAAFSPPAHRTASAAGFGLTDDEITSLLYRHNDWRSRYKSAPLAWDNNLAALASDWANQLAAGDGSINHRPNNQYGENIWAGSAGGYSVANAVDDWGNEVNAYNLSANTCADGQDCGHFTQVVWSGTARVGCGKATGAGMDFVVCNYDPPGNFDGQSPFAAATAQKP